MYCLKSYQVEEYFDRHFIALLLKCLVHIATSIKSGTPSAVKKRNKIYEYFHKNIFIHQNYFIFIFEMSYS